MQVGRALLCGALLAFGTGCSAGDEQPTATPTPTKAPTPFNISVTPTVSGNQVAVDGTTNLPDGAKLTILLGREATFAADGEPRMIHLGGDPSEVQGGKFSATIPLDESMLSTTIESGTFGDLVSVSDTVAVCTQLRATDSGKAFQPPNVREAIGDAGERLSASPQKTKFGDETWLEAIEEVNAPSALLGELTTASGGAVKHAPSTGELWCSS